MKNFSFVVESVRLSHSSISNILNRTNQKQSFNIFYLLIDDDDYSCKRFLYNSYNTRRFINRKFLLELFDTKPLKKPTRLFMKVVFVLLLVKTRGDRKCLSKRRIDHKICKNQVLCNRYY